MSKHELHEHEFLLLLLDLADGAPIYSEEYEEIEQAQEKFLINEENKYDVAYTIKESDVLNHLHKDNIFAQSSLSSHLKEKRERRMFPFTGEKNE